MDKCFVIQSNREIYHSDHRTRTAKNKSPCSLFRRVGFFANDRHLWSLHDKIVSRERVSQDSPWTELSGSLAEEVKNLKLTPLEIKKQEFKKTIRGLDPIEVETFLEMVADEFEYLIREKNELADEVLKVKTQLRDYQDVEKTLKETLMHAQQNINHSRETSEREAEILMRDAELKAEKVVEDAKLKLAALKNELVIVKAQKESFAHRLRHLLVSQLDLIEVLELDDLGFEKLSEKRIKRRRQKPKNQEQIEFGGIDDVLQENSGEPPPEVDHTDAQHITPHSNWQGTEETTSDENKIEEDSEKKTRISDKLIF